MTSTRSVLFGQPITPDTLDDLFAHHRQQFGGWRMEDTSGGDAGGDEGGGSGGEGAAGGGDQAGSGSGSGSGGDAGGEKRFTQADLDALISKRLGEEKVKFDKQLEQMQADAGKTEKERAEAERDRYKEQAESAGKTAGERVAKTEAKVAAILAGARDDRLDAVLKQADLTGVVGDDGEVDEAKVKTAIEAVLKDYPEWKRTPGSSGTDRQDSADGKPTFTRQQIRDMPAEERAKRADELALAMAEGRITGS